MVAQNNGCSCAKLGEHSQEKQLLLGTTTRHTQKEQPAHMRTTSYTPYHGNRLSATLYI